MIEDHVSRLSMMCTIHLTDLPTIFKLSVVTVLQDRISDVALS